VTGLFEGTDEIFDQLVEVVRYAVGEIPFGQRPDPLVGVEFRRVGRKLFEVEAGMPALEGGQGFPPVRRRVIQDHN
jgi:hypothetical protein